MASGLPKPLVAEYNDMIESIRDLEYPMLKDAIYLDHAGTAIPPKSLMDRFASDMTSNLYGNPHSTSAASQKTSRTIESIRLRLLGLLKADPEIFDLVFVANATAGIKLVAEAFREFDDGFWYGYHRDSHTSLVGVRELAKEQRCFTSDLEVEEWLRNPELVSSKITYGRLLGYPAQSNMNGRRISLNWCRRIRKVYGGAVYTLLDAAALLSTAPLDFSDSGSAPDYTVMSLYKIFGFPDLGALVVKKSAAAVLQNRRYFGGGTVEMVTCLKDQWHVKKSGAIHEQLEDGSLPIRNIIALQSALDVFEKLFGSLERVSIHCAHLVKTLHDNLAQCRHSNSIPVCHFYHQGNTNFTDRTTQGPIITFNMRNRKGVWIGASEVDKLASIKNIHLRTGNLCNPGGIAHALDLAPLDMRRNYSEGQRCGNDHDVMHGCPTGVVRVSLGPMNTLRDVLSFVDFVKEFFVESAPCIPTSIDAPFLDNHGQVPPASYHVESLTIYPLKSCAGWAIPQGMPWRIHNEGLALDREWCLILSGSGNVMNQKRYPRMALVRPRIDVKEGLLWVSFAEKDTTISSITIPLYTEPSSPFTGTGCLARQAKVCGDTIEARVYDSPEITSFFTQALGVPCQLARFPPSGESAYSRHSKSHLQPIRGTYYHGDRDVHQHEGLMDGKPRPILLSNESPVLAISKSSLNRLNEQIKSNGGRAVRAEVFRANIVLADNVSPAHRPEQPYAEDQWHMMRIGDQLFELLGPCRRCQMICIDQDTGARSTEPFVTLAKTRRFDGKIFFGQHACHVQSQYSVRSGHHAAAAISVGDPVTPFERQLEEPACS